jgi:uncharacterized membrane protein HdeD (DUF308 family)
VPTADSAPQRSLALLGTTAALFALGLILEIWGGLNFPPNAPVEQIYCVLLVFDTAAGFVVATTGAIIAARDRHPLRRSSVVTIVGAALVGIALIGWIWLSGIAIVGHLTTGDRGRYMYDVAGAVWFGIPWIVGTALCAFGYRRGGSRGNAVRGLLGTIAGLALLAATVTSAVLYGLGLTD